MRKRTLLNPTNITATQMIESLVYVHDHFLKHFGKVDVTLGEYQFLVRGEKVLPMPGIGDVLAAMYSKSWKDGKVRGIAGESYIMMVRYPKTGLPIIETVNVYGASNDPSSPHYDDQMEMFVNQQLKPMTLDINAVRKSAERIYSPR